MNEKDSNVRKYTLRSKEKRNERNKIKNIEGIDDDNVMMYGEFVTSYFAWLPIGKQMEKAEELNGATKNVNEKSKIIKNVNKK